MSPHSNVRLRAAPSTPCTPLAGDPETEGAARRRNGRGDCLQSAIAIRRRSRRPDRLDYPNGVAHRRCSNECPELTARFRPAGASRRPASTSTGTRSARVVPCSPTKSRAADALLRRRPGGAEGVIIHTLAWRARCISGASAELMRPRGCYESDRVATKTGMILLVFIW
jgi:hypothetical protein